MKVGILNIGGNTASIWYAIERLGYKASLIERIKDQNAIIIPGQGKFNTGLSRISSDLKEEILFFKGPVIGICLGMQLLFDKSEEGPGNGLGIFNGSLTRLPIKAQVPHIGWDKCSDKQYYYFAHSYYVPANGQKWKDLTCNYAKIDFIASCHKNNFIGCQFHPEKSGKAGHEFLKKCLTLA